MNDLPSRKLLPHEVPGWVKDGSVYFITLCSMPRGSNQLCHQNVGQAVLDSVAFYHQHQKWYASLALLMPDHLHMLLSFPRQSTMQKTIAAWKRFMARNQGLEWQRDFFEHRLRHDESEVEKAVYIRDNPVRAGLITDAEECPYVWRPTASDNNWAPHHSPTRG